MVAKYRKNKRPAGKKLVLPVVLGAMVFLLAIFLIRANLKLHGTRRDLAAEAEIIEKELQALEEQKELLQSEISWSAEADYLEAMARNIRNLMKEGEKAVVIVPPSEESEIQEEEAKGFLDNMLDWLK